VPTDINLDVIYDAKKRQRIAGVESSGHLMLGVSRLENFRLPETSEESNARQFILATTEVDGKQVEAELYLLSQFPLVGVKLRKPDDWALEETWAKTVFGKPYGDLTNEQKDELQASFTQAEREFKNRRRRDEGEMERGRGKSIVTPGEESSPAEKPSDDAPKSDDGGSKERKPLSLQLFGCVLYLV
jgi:hypothetical protein